MRAWIQGIAQQLIGKQNLEECSVEEVKRIAERYPYFAPAQFLLLQKLRQEGTTEEADQQYKKAVLFCPDPLQFEFFISSEKFYTDENESALPQSVSPVEEENPALNFYPEERINHTADIEEISNPIVQDSEPANGAVKIQVPEHVDTRFNDRENGDTEIPDIEPINQPQEIENTFTANTQPVSSTSPQTVSELATETETTAGHKAPDLVFEPYHTVDYFASQGIKISVDELPKDKLGKQLKSFTEWLKTMKRLPTPETAQTLQRTDEKKVETLAVDSVTDSEVITEAMAEVWAKQGNSEKALDIYNKLVLLNPSKRTYFAAKIETLKQS